MIVFIDLGSQAALVEDRVFFGHQWLSKGSLARTFSRTGPHGFITGDADFVLAEDNTVVQAIGRQGKGSIGFDVSASGLPAGGLEHDDAEFERAAVLQDLACDRNHLRSAVAAGKDGEHRDGSTNRGLNRNRILRQLRNYLVVGGRRNRFVDVDGDAVAYGMYATVDVCKLR